MDVEITKADGTSYRLSDHDVVVRDFSVSSIEMIPTYSGIDGRHGYVDMGATYGSRTIRIPFYINAFDMLDVALIRDKLFELVSVVESFYILEMRRPKYAPMYFCDGDESVREYGDVYVGGKRYKVRLSSSPFEIEQMFTYGYGEMVFETTDLPFAESIVTTMDIERYGVPNVGMGLDPNESYIYEYRLMSERAFDEQFILPWQTIPAESLGNTSFSIYNAGIPIHPFEQRLKITIKNAIGSDEYIELKNITNGTTFRLNEGLGDKELVIDRGQVTLNGLQSLRQTNKEFIELDHGWNQFEISGMDIVTVQFNFNFYYL